MDTSIHRATAQDFPQLADLWRRSVTASHDFLTPEAIDALYTEVRDIYLAAVDVWVFDMADKPCAFMGLSHEEGNTKVEMLFVEPDLRGKGAGTRLLEHARALHGALTVDVNEQNPRARDFYLARRFHITGRSPLDGQGRPFPLLHLAEKAST